MQSAIISGLFLLANLHFNHHKANGIVSTGGDGNSGPGQQHTVIKKFSPHPYFDFDVPRNITTRVGQTAFINCRVEQIGDKWVSWIRKRDLHILSAGMVVYTSDERFQVTRSEKSDVWTMQIKFAQQRDSGAYECQVNTVPKMSMTFQLNVVEAKALILGPTDIYVKIGSAVTLTCIITQGPHDLGTIYWYRGTSTIKPTETHPNETSIAYPPRISVDLKWTEALTSRLKILDAKLSDSGNYTCLPTSAEASSVMVHVLNEENPAAMQRGGSITRHCATICQLQLLVLLVFLFPRYHHSNWSPHS
ncbi:zwei Ig domain protein zig-8-like [Malaya genurostris]|uniref:zwei Ig domain protein zig-8-like n=1 Tax=Malaya genurostris TaxID=325434 RepID=UPI0026F3985A|nr:zwei Ig domain protein zig-8-like [Malaya genurostris]XP_058446689.1 zwei Ig domain protein zig-8-like [Malaya genurostris]